MPLSPRVRLRAARRLQERYESLHQQPLLPDPPVAHWEIIQQAWRQWRLCRQHELPAVGRLAEERYLRQLDRLGTRCRDLVAVARQQDEQPVPTLRDLHSELQVLEDEFTDIQIDLRQQLLAVTTEPIILEGIELGPFEVRLDWASLADSSPYQVIPLDPHPARECRDTPHPHVHCQTLCEGDARYGIQTALQQGRLCDLFLLIRSVLQTYNPGSAYTRLADWEGVNCSDCGHSSPPEETGSCARCNALCCDDCLGCCGECGDSLCSSCEQTCSGCDAHRCSACLESCAVCADSFCRTCLDAGLCAPCLEQELENDHDDLEDEASPAEDALPSPAEAVP